MNAHRHKLRRLFLDTRDIGVLRYASERASLRVWESSPKIERNAESGNIVSALCYVKNAVFWWRIDNVYVHDIREVRNMHRQRMNG